MTQNQSNKKITIQNRIIILLSIIGLIFCIAALFPQVRRMIMEVAERIAQREASTYQSWLKTLLAYAMGGICFILFFDYCTLTHSGRKFACNVKQELKDCLSGIDFRSFVRPLCVMFGVYFLGILAIIRANFSYMDDLQRAVEGFRTWYNWSRYISEFASIFVHGDPNLTDISPLPQLLAVLILACSSVLLVYVIGNKKITTVRLLASIPLGLSPYFLGCIVYKFDAPYMALSILASIVPFLFIARKRAFIFCSIVSLLVMCMTYQAASGIYMLIVIMLCFQDWNTCRKNNKEILSFLGIAAFTFCFALLLFRFFLMKPADYYATTAMHPLPHIISGTIGNIKNYAMIINKDWGMIWKIGIILVGLFFIAKSMHNSTRKKPVSFFASTLVIGISFILSYGVYSLLIIYFYDPRTLYGFGVFLAIMCIYIVSDYKKAAIVIALALNWCLFVFAFSYGNALADQARYAEFRTTILLHDLSALFPSRNREYIQFQLKNSIDYAPTIKNIAKHYPIIKRLLLKRLADVPFYENYYYLEYFNFSSLSGANLPSNNNFIDFDTLGLPVVLDSYYHTIQSDGDHVLITLKH